MIEYIPKGVCPKKITFDIEDNIIKNVIFHSGCQGNLQAISILIEGLPAQEVIRIFKGIQCKQRGTSCPDQLAIAIENILAEIDVKKIHKKK